MDAGAAPAAGSPSAPRPGARSLRDGDCLILHDPALLAAPQAAHFDPAHWRDAQRGEARGRGSAIVFRPPPPLAAGAGDWVLREYLRGGLPAKLLKRQYAWLGRERSRSWREFRLLQALRSDGLPAPRPVAAAAFRGSLSYRGALLMQAVPGAQSLADRLATGAFALREDWPGLREVLRRVFAAGYFHADLNARNLLRDAHGGWWVIDWDRGRAGVAPARCRSRLRRLERSLRKIAAAEGWAPGPTSALLTALDQELRA